MCRASRLPAGAVGPDQPTFVIAEIGVNHDGSVQTALRLVEIAVNAGADAVKLQIFRAATLLHPSAALASYQKDRVQENDPAAMLRKYELSPDDTRRVVDAIRQRKMAPLATPFSPSDIPLIEGLDLPAIKIASPDLANLLLLKRAARVGRPLLLSTGAATMEEVAATVQWLTLWKTPFALLHCISSYPVQVADANLRWICHLSQQFNVPVGFSDHSAVEMAGALAVAGGAVLVEKHLTYDRGALGTRSCRQCRPGAVQAICRGDPAGRSVEGIAREARAAMRGGSAPIEPPEPGDCEGSAGEARSRGRGCHRAAAGDWDCAGDAAARARQAHLARSRRARSSNGACWSEAEASAAAQRQGGR